LCVERLFSSYFLNFTMTDAKVIFLGTPEFAVASLEAIVENGFSVVAVVTSPDKPAGRGLKLAESAVKRYALGKNIPVLQPVKLKDPVFLEELRSFGADIQVVVAFRMLPEVVWAMPRLGTINLHGSLLPEYRGAAPINRAIMNGETITGVTTFKLQQEIDTGNILLQEEIPIGKDENAGELHDRMKRIGAALTVTTIREIIFGELTERPQILKAETNLKTAPKIFSEDCVIQWSDPTKKIYDQIRGLSPYPGAFTVFNGKMLKIFRSKSEITDHGRVPGLIDIEKTELIRFTTSDGYIYPEDLQPEGKKRMSVTDFLRGYRGKENQNTVI
jgi:methionyl-tRNA formyltransferase